MPGVPDIYYEQYDRIHHDKDYRSEVEAVLEFARMLGLSKPRNVLDVGCGTGNHSIEFARRGFFVTAVDREPRILSTAVAKLAHVGDPPPAVLLGGIEDLDLPEADLAVALFNVVSYLCDEAALRSFFSSVNKQMRPGGLFVFDCWNGPAVRRDPPRSSVKEIRDTPGGGLRIEGRGWLECEGRVAVVRYSVSGIGDDTGVEYEYDMRSTLWDPAVLRRALADAGFGAIRISKWMEPGEEAGNDDWKVMVGAVKR